MIIWKTAVGSNGYYEVSNSGLVRSVDRVYKTGQYYKERKLPGRVLKPKIDKDGYLAICFNVDGVKSHKRVSRLVCEAFHPNPENKPQVNHKNGDRKCNYDWNLEWVTSSENIIHSWVVLKRKPYSPMTGRIGFLSPFSKPLYQYDMNDILVKTWGSVGEAALAGFSRTRLKRCINGSQNFYKGFKWSR